MTEGTTSPGAAPERPRAAARRKLAPIVFVGGTGRSGTHVVARLLARHTRVALIPVECRFHVEEGGFPGLLAGRVSTEDFARRMRGFWWKGFRTSRFRGLFRFVHRDRFDAALAAFEQRFDSDPEGACRQLFYDLLWFRAEEKPGGRAIVEQSCDTIAAAPTLVRLFPEARFVHVVRDGRDASASRVSQTRGLIYPRTRRQGLEWWDRRIRAIDAGARAIPDGQLLELGLEELLAGRRRRTLARLAHFVGIGAGSRMRRFLFGRMSSEAANAARWRRGLSARKQREIDRLYADILDRLEADGVTCTPLLRQAQHRGWEPT